MKKTLIILLALFPVITLAACSNGTQNTASTEITVSAVPSENPGYKSITPADAKAMIGQQNVILVDVRTEEEYAETRIPGSVLLPVDDITAKAQSVLPDKDATIIVYCRTGRRSKIAANELLGMGYKNVYDLGGIVDWPYETITG